MAKDNAAEATVSDISEAKSRKPRIPVRVETMAQFLDEFPEPVTLARGKEKDMTVFAEMVKYLEGGHHNNGNGRILGINFVGTDAAKQKAGQMRAAIVDGKYPVPDGWNWEVVARPIVEKDSNGNDKSVGSTLYFKTTKKLAKSAKGTASTPDKVTKRTRKAKGTADAENASAE